MGVYSHYDSVMSGSGDIVAADESYVGAIGAYQMIEESEINSYNIFESVIGRDFAEAGNSFGVVSESDMEAINEASAVGIWEKVVAFVQKIWAKIKGILNSIKTKIEGTLTRDSKALYNKYKKTVNSKLNNGKLSDFKFKWKDTKSKDGIDRAFGTSIKEIIKSSPIRHGITTNLTSANKLKELSEIGGKKAPKSIDVYTGKEGEKKASIVYSDKSDVIAKYNNTEDTGNGAASDYLRPYTSDECTDMLEETLGLICEKVGGSSGSVSAKEFPKEFHDAIFDDEEEKDKISDVLDEIIGVLEGGKKILKDITDAQKECDRASKKDRSDTNNVAKAMQKANESKDTQSTFAAAANRLAGRTTTCLNIMSRVSGMAFSAATSVVKEHIKQCRAVWIKAAAYNQKKAPYEEATLLEAMADVSDYEVEEMFAM